MQLLVKILFALGIVFCLGVLLVAAGIGLIGWLIRSLTKEPESE